MESKKWMIERVEKAAEGYTLSIENILQGGLNYFRRAPAAFILYSLLVALCYSNPISGILLGGPALAGYFLVCRQMDRNISLNMGDFLKGMEHFGPLLVLYLMISVLVLLGLGLLVIPGVYLALSFSFASFFIIFSPCSPGEALRLSHKLVSANLFNILLLFLVLAGINLLGFLLLGVGLFISMPLSACTLYAAFNDIIGSSET